MRYRGSYYPDGSTQYIDEFGGLDLRNRIANNSFSEMLNMSPEGAPEIVTRARRYLSKAQFDKMKEYITALTTATVCRDDLTGTTPSNKEFTEEPVYVLTRVEDANVSNMLIFGADGNATRRGFFSVDLNSSEEKHSLAIIGRRIMIAPEMILVDLDTGTVSHVEETTTATTFAFTDADLTDFGAEINTGTKIYASTTGHPGAEGDPNGSYYAMVRDGEIGARYEESAVTSQNLTGVVLFAGFRVMKYFATSAAWVAQDNYLKLFTTDAEKFHEGDAVSISGVKALTGEYIIHAVGDGFIVINGDFSGTPFDYCPKIDSGSSIPGEWTGDWDGKTTFGLKRNWQELPEADRMLTATITRKKPPIVQHICESGNRIWWCGFGQTENDGLINEIGCSDQGDPYNYYTAGKTWTTNVGPAGDFTGACEIGGTPVFFKEDCIFEVGGSLPSSFRATRRDTRGIEKESAGALCVSGGSVYYHASDGPRVYGGSYSQRLTGAFGFGDVGATAFADDGRFIYMAAEKVVAHPDGTPAFAGEDIPEISFGLGSFPYPGEPALYLYDTERGTVHRMENHHFTALAAFSGGGVIGYDATDGRLMSTKRISHTDKETAPVPWQLTTGDVYANTPDMKYISAARVRMRVAAGGYAELWLSCDRGQWERQAYCAKEGVFTYRVPIIPGRCDSFRLRLNGEGQARLVSIAYEITDGGQGQ